MKENEIITFADVLLALEDGYVASRNIWADFTYLFKQVPIVVSINEVDGVFFLPRIIKEIIKQDIQLNKSKDIVTIQHTNSLAILDPEHNIREWNITTEDLHATDWMIFKT